MTGKSQVPDDDECTIPGDSVPAELLARYSVDRDVHNESDIKAYINGQAPDEEVLHVELVKKEYVIGEVFEIWDVTTDVDRWWVITNFTNLYSQTHFKSLDYTLSFHIGLMMRLRSRAEGANISDPTPFDDVFRRQEQSKDKYDKAVEAEDFQSVGMLLRECLVTLVAAMRRQLPDLEIVDPPQNANFTEWSEVLSNHLCGGKSNKVLRSFFKNTSRETWQLVNWLTHYRKADKTASMTAMQATDNVIGNYFQLLMRNKTDSTKNCPQCQSRDIRSHYDIHIEPDGDYFVSCGTCDWSNHPHEA